MEVKNIQKNKFRWLNTPCIISTVYIPLFNEYQTMVMFEDGEEIDSYTTYSKEEALQLHKTLVEQWKDKLFTYDKQRVGIDRDSLVTLA